MSEKRETKGEDGERKQKESERAKGKRKERREGQRKRKRNARRKLAYQMTLNFCGPPGGTAV